MEVNGLGYQRVFHSGGLTKCSKDFDPVGQSHRGQGAVVTTANNSDVHGSVREYRRFITRFDIPHGDALVAMRG